MGSQVQVQPRADLAADAVRQLVEMLADPVTNPDGFRPTEILVTLSPSEDTLTAVARRDDAGGFRYYEYAIYCDEGRFVADGS